MVVSVSSFSPSPSRAPRPLEQRHHVAPHQRLAAGDAELVGAEADERGAQPVQLLQRQHLRLRQEGHVLGHAVDAAQVAAVGDRDAQIGDGAAERIDHGRRWTPCGGIAPSGHGFQGRPPRRGQGDRSIAIRTYNLRGRTSRRPSFACRTAPRPASRLRRSTRSSSARCCTTCRRRIVRTFTRRCPIPPGFAHGNQTHSTGDSPGTAP